MDRPDIKVNAFPWWLVCLAGIFIETPRERNRMRYLWKALVRVDNEKLAALLGKEPRTPMYLAVSSTLLSLNVY